VDKRKTPPGDHGKKAAFRRKMSDYGTQMREKQKARRIYGVLERQFRRYFKEASRRKGMTGATLLVILESRLDNVVYRLGFADSRSQARQLVRHGHFQLNGRKVNVPSLIVQAGDNVAVNENSRSMTYFKDRLHLMGGANRIPTWLTLNPGEMSGSIAKTPAREDIDVALNEQLIVEYYSR
jgi:small subunit ribosomal protein S4